MEDTIRVETWKRVGPNWFGLDERTWGGLPCWYRVTPGRSITYQVGGRGTWTQLVDGDERREILQSLVAWQQPHGPGAAEAGGRGRGSPEGRWPELGPPIGAESEPTEARSATIGGQEVRPMRIPLEVILKILAIVIQELLALEQQGTVKTVDLIMNPDHPAIRELGVRVAERLEREL